MDTKFEQCHSGGDAYTRYKSLESKFTDEFRELMMDILIHKYVYHELGTAVVSDQFYDQLVDRWYRMANYLEIDMSVYPYKHGFPHTHPYSAKAATLGKSRVGL